MSGKFVTMPENVIINIGLIEGKNNALFSINGYGGCNACSELYSIYSLEGEMLYTLYQTEPEVHAHYGTLTKVLSRYGVNEKDYRSGNYKKVDVYSSLTEQFQGTP